MSSFVLSAFFLSFFPFNRGKRSGPGLQAGMQLFVAAARISFFDPSFAYGQVFLVLVGVGLFIIYLVIYF